MPPRRVPQLDASDQEIIDATRAILRYELPPGASPRAQDELRRIKWGLRVEIKRRQPRTYKRVKSYERRFE